MKHFAFFTFLFLSFSANADAPNWTIDPAASTLKFEGKQSGQAFTGAFKKFDGKITFDAAQLDQSYAAITVDTRSIQVDGEGSQYVNAPEWFDTAAFPTATFETTGLEKAATGFIAHGNLTIRDVTLPIDLQFTLAFAPDGKTVKMQGTVTLNRLDYHLGTGSWADPTTVGPAVTVHVNVTAAKAP